MPIGKSPSSQSAARNESSAEPLDPDLLTRSIEAYLAEHPAAAVLEDGRVLFDLRSARYAVAESHGRCLLQFWSEERNIVRSVTDLQSRSTCLRLTTRKMGSAIPQCLELIPNLDRRTPSERDAARRTYLRALERALARGFPDRKLDGLRSAMDLEHSFGPAYARGRLLKGNAADAVIGIGPAESGTAIQGILTLGVLWLDHCRQQSEARRHFGGLKVVVPAGASRTTAERMAWLDHDTAHFELFEFDQHTEELAAIDYRDTGNLESHLAHAFSASAAMERCRPGLDRLAALIPDHARDRVEFYPRSAMEVDLLLHGLEFARVRCAPNTHSFVRGCEITFGAGAHETQLTPETELFCRSLLARLFESRAPQGDRTHPLFRMQPERWLEARIRSSLDALLPSARTRVVYSQVPALTRGDRGMLDLLTLDRDARLTVIELKADEDLHLPMQALDYWIRVRALNEDRKMCPAAGRPLSAFERQGYFPGSEVSALPPRLLLMGPALRIHPANERVLRFLSPRIDWELIALHENWRNELSVVFRKHGGTA